MEGQSVFTLLLLATALGGAVATLYQDCGTTAEVHDFTITDCDVPPCVVPRPSIYNVNITFTPASDAIELNTIIEATILGDTFPWPGPDGCPLLENDSCPLQAGRQYKYSAFMPVLEEYPAISVVVSWKLQDENDVIHFCALFPIVLV
ncbi:NPC intracellular cholesterol transporter 2-like [Eriocheir sinensis]|uniref:NPC intracellular cholesterol transporter 2-like n=1 Tax=Eriocheir sinensis TaxID=95602 RepID=UPI0021C6A154|nr:NPC intracellular cholesterol transporter 2-like [Eriocheir sinensis]UYG50033.1 NPC2 [Eriocheir sinensis]